MCGYYFVYLPKLRPRMIDDKCKRHKKENKNKHVINRRAVYSKVYIELTCENDEGKNEWKYRSRPDKDKDTKKNKARMPDSEGDGGGDILIDACKCSNTHFLHTGHKCLTVRVDKVKSNS